jgi:hypothetical protein
MRYGVALVVAIGVIAANAFFVRQTWQSHREKVRQALRDAKANGTLPAGVDPETADTTNVGLRMSSDDLLRISLADLLVKFQAVLVPLVVLGSLGIAWLLGGGDSRRKQDRDGQGAEART